jgi:LuxR family transcriptional regulator, maltose regulon positive regulatory protein
MSAESLVPGFPDLVRTKLGAPPLRPGVLVRDVPARRLAESATFGRLAVVTAPAGWGKSTLLAQWQAVDAHGDSFAWVSLDEGDNDAVRFWLYVLAALADVEPGACPASGRMLTSTGSVVLADVVRALANDLTAVGTPLTLVLDDYHLITSDDVHALLGLLIRHLPRNVRLVLATRAALPVALGVPRLRGRGLVVELTVDDLRFSADESRLLLDLELDGRLSERDTARLHEWTEGWAAGLHLAALSLRGRDDAAELIATFAGDDRHVAEYLAGEVLGRQPQQMSTFLRRTSVLPRFCAPLCAAVTEDGAADALLERAERDQLFVIPMDNRRYWYRFHHLFGDHLRHELDRVEPGAAAGLHRLAAGWCEEHGLPIDAVGHALASGDLDLATDLVVAHHFDVGNTGQVETVLGWFDRLGLEAVSADPRLSLARATLAMYAGDVDGMARWLDVAEHATPADPRPELTAELEAGTAIIRQIHAYGSGDSGGALRWATIAMERIADRRSQWYATTQAYWSVASFRTGRADDAIRGFVRCVGLGEVIGYHLLALCSAGYLALFHGERGETDAADRWIAYAGRVTEEYDLGAHHLGYSWLLARGWLSLSTGDASAAEADLSRALEMVRRGPFRLEQVEILSALATARERLGDVATPARLRATARRLLALCPDPGHLVARPSAARVTGGAAAPGENPHRLTDRELTILRLVAEGLTNAQVANRLQLSERTVAAHLRSIYAKVGLASRSAATRYAVEHGLT